MQEVTGSSPVPSTKTTRLIRVGSFCFGGRYRTRTARAERSEGNQSPSGALISARFPTHRNVYRDDCRFVVDGTELEQHGTAAGGTANTPVGCLLVRGSQRLGMSTKKDVARPFGLGMWWAVQNSNSNKQRQGITVAVCPAFCFASPYIVRFGSIAAYVRTWSVRTYAGKRASSDI